MAIILITKLDVDNQTARGPVHSTRSSQTLVHKWLKIEPSHLPTLCTFAVFIYKQLKVAPHSE